MQIVPTLPLFTPSLWAGKPRPYSFPPTLREAATASTLPIFKLVPHGQIPQPADLKMRG